MEPKTTNVDGEQNLVDDGKEVGITVDFRAKTTTTLMPKTGEELFASTVQEFAPGAIAGIVGGAAVIALMIAKHKRSKVRN